jgi:hypothetical protein
MSPNDFNNPTPPDERDLIRQMDQSQPQWVILPFIGGMIVGFIGTMIASIVLLMVTGAIFNANYTGWIWILVVVVLGVILVTIYRAFVTGWIRTPFNAGLIVGGCLFLLLLGVCFGLIAAASR